MTSSVRGPWAPRAQAPIHPRPGHLRRSGRVGQGTARSRPGHRCDGRAGRARPARPPARLPCALWSGSRHARSRPLCSPPAPRPPRAKRLGRRVGQLPCLGPAREHWQRQIAKHPHERGQPEQGGPAPATFHRGARRGEQRVRGTTPLRPNGVVAELDEHRRDVDPDRAELVARPAQRRGEWQL